MFTHQSTIRVRYSETDQMGIAHHSSYVAWLEEARTDAMRALGYTYKSVEESGVIMPVIDVQISYHKAAYYDDVLTIETQIRQPISRIACFDYEIWNNSVKLSSAKVKLVFQNVQSQKLVSAPKELTAKIRQHF